MLVQTPGIVLRTLKFQETSLILSLYTREQGMRSLLAKGVRSSRSTKQGTYQLLHELEVSYLEKPGRELQTLRDAHLTAPYRHLTSDPQAMLYGLLIAEVYYRAVREQEPNSDLYHLLHATLWDLDQRPGSRYAATLWWLLQLTRPLGCFPLVVDAAAREQVFDLSAGVLRPMPGSHEPEAVVLAHLAAANDVEAAVGIQVPQALRQPALRLLLRFIGTHVEGFRQPMSLDVFESVFRDT